VRWPDYISILSLALSGALLTVAGIGHSNADSDVSSVIIVDSVGQAAYFDTTVADVGLIVITEGTAAVPADTPFVNISPIDIQPASPPPASASPCININTATESQLITIRGIGPVLAANIVNYRTANGPFRKKEDLIKVKGIGPAKFAQITEQTCL